MNFLGFFWSRDFQILLGAAAMSALALVILRRFTGFGFSRLALKIAYGIIFFPVLILPVFKCCFKVPYVFCRACPSKCPWGISRTLLIGSFLALNLFGKFWCFSMCPFGTCQEYQAQVLKKNFQPLRNPHVLSYPLLILTGWMHSLTITGSSILASIEIGHYSWVWVTVTIAAAIFIAVFFIPKFWCRYMCPIGAIAELAPINLSR